jgi:hypothetical protein
MNLGVSKIHLQQRSTVVAGYDPRFARHAGYFASFIKTVVVVVVATGSESVVVV